MSVQISERIITAMLLVIAVIHIIPISGFAGVNRLQDLYGIPINGNNLEILMRHRAILFGILGFFFAYAAFKPALQPLAFIAAFMTLASFFYLAYSVGGYNEAVRKVVTADVIAAISLLVACIVFYLKPAQ